MGDVEACLEEGRDHSFGSIFTLSSNPSQLCGDSIELSG